MTLYKVAVGVGIVSVLITIALWRRKKIQLAPKQIINTKGLKPQKFYRFINGSWIEPKTSNKVTFPANIRVSHYNVLFDLYADQEPIVQSPKRFAEQFKRILPEQNADIISLNEVTEHYLGKLLQLDWVRDNYFVTRFSNKTIYNPGVDERDFFVVLLSKIPFHRVWNYYFDPLVTWRNAVVGTFKLPNNKLLTVCTTHLKAMPDFHAVRKKQFEELFTMLATQQGEIDSSVLVGDFNIMDWEAEIFNDHAERTFIVRDIWKEVRSDEGHTYDAERNSMIRKMWEATNEKYRLDRALIVEKKGNKSSLVPVSAHLFGEEQIEENVFPSDHFGVSYDFELSNRTNL